MTLMSRPPVGARATVLVVDGAAHGRAQTAAMLRGLGYAADTSGDAFYALALLASDTSIRALVVDMDPGADFDAHILVSQALILRPDLPVVLYTARADKFHGRTIAGRLRVLAKPFTTNDLAKAVAEAVRTAMHRRLHGNGPAATVPSAAMHAPQPSALT